MAGRPSKYADPLLSTIVDWLERGCTRKAACAAAGIHKDTFADWMLHKDGFSDLVVRAEAVAERRWVKMCERAKPGAAIKLLSKRFRDDWGDEVKLEVTGGIRVTYVNDWRGSTPDAPSGTETSTL